MNAQAITTENFIPLLIRRQKFNLTPLFPCKYSWDFECNDILKIWKMIFQALDVRGKQFLDLLDDNFSLIKSSYFKEGL